MSSVNPKGSGSDRAASSGNVISGISATFSLPGGSFAYLKNKTKFLSAFAAANQPVVGATVKVFVADRALNPVGAYIATGITGSDGSVVLPLGSQTFTSDIKFILYATDVNGDTSICIPASTTHTCSLQDFTVAYFLKSVAEYDSTFDVRTVSVADLVSLNSETATAIVTSQQVSETYDEALNTMVTKINNLGIVPSGPLAAGDIPDAPPVFTSVSPDTYSSTVMQGNAQTFTVAAGDFKKRALSYLWTTSGISGTGAGSTTDSFTFTASSDATGTGSVQVSVTAAGSGVQLVKEFSLTATDLNFPPLFDSNGDFSADSIISGNSATVSENGTVSFFAVASDPDNDTIRYAADCLPTGATFDTDPNSGSYRQFSWTPSYSVLSNSTASSTFYVRFKLKDVSIDSSLNETDINGYPTGLSSNCSDYTNITSSNQVTVVRITVNNQNRAPTLTDPGAKSVAEGSTLSFSYAGSDADGDTLTYTSVALPAGATLNSSTGAFSWTPGYTQSGAHTATVKVCDSASVCSANNTINITVSNTNRAPSVPTVGSSASVSYTVSEGQTLTFTVDDPNSPSLDADGDTVTLTSNVPAGSSFNSGTRSFTWSPDFTKGGTTYSAIFTGTDNGTPNLSSSHAVSIAVVDTAPPVASFAVASASGAESTTAVNIVTQLSYSSSITATVDYAVTGGTATGGGVDYTLASGTVTFSPGQTSKNIALTIVNDTTYEASETIVVTMTNPVAASVGTTSTHTYTITDNDTAPTIEFGTITSTVAEGDSANTSHPITINLSGSSALTASVNYAVTSGTANAGGDYTLASGTVTFTPGQTSKSITATINGDYITEADEDFTVTLSSPSSATLAANTTHQVTISNDDVLDFNMLNSNMVWTSSNNCGSSGGGSTNNCCGLTMYAASTGGDGLFAFRQMGVAITNSSGAALSVTATSNNQGSLPDGDVFVSISGGNLNFYVARGSVAVGTSPVVTVNVSNGYESVSRTVTLTRETGAVCTY